MAASVLVLSLIIYFVVFTTTHSQPCNNPGTIQNSFISQPPSLIPNQQCSLKLPLIIDSISQNSGNPDVVSVLRESKGSLGCQSPCLSNIGSSCSINENGIFIPCETPIVLNIDIPNGVTACNLGCSSGNSESCINQNGALNCAALRLVSNGSPCASPVSSISNSASKSLSSCNIPQCPSNTGSNLNVLGNSDSFCLPGPSNSKSCVEPLVCQGNTNIRTNSLNIQTSLPQLSDVFSTPSKSLQNSQTFNIVSNIGNNRPCSVSESIRSQVTDPSCISSISVPNFNPNWLSNQPAVISSQTSTVSLPITMCTSTSDIKTPIYSPKKNIVSSLPINPFATCNAVPTAIKPSISSIDCIPSVNSPSLTSNIMNSPCSTVNSNTNLASCANAPSINILSSSLSPSFLNSPCVGSSPDLIDDYVISQSTSPCIIPFPNVRTVTSVDSTGNSIVTSVNSNIPNTQTFNAIPCGCSKVSSVSSPLNAIPCQCSKLPSSVSLNFISPINTVSLDDNYNSKLIQTNSLANCKSQANDINLPLILNSNPSVNCHANTPSVLPQVITSSTLDLSNYLSSNSQCNTSPISSINLPTLVTATSPAATATTSFSPVIATTIIDNTVSNSLANALQLLIVSNLIQSLNTPTTLTSNNLANVDTIATSTVVQAGNSLATGTDLASVNVATTTIGNAYYPELETQTYYEDVNPYNGYQEQYYPNFYDIVAQKVLEECPLTGSLAPIASKILGLPELNLPIDDSYYNGPYDNNLRQNTFCGPPELFYGAPKVYPDRNFCSEPNFYGIQENYPEPFYGIPETYPEVNNYYAVPDTYPDPSYFYNAPEVYDIQNYYATPESLAYTMAVPYTVDDFNVANSYSIPTPHESINYFVPDLNTASTANVYIPSYSAEIIPDNSIIDSLYLIPENIPISNPSYTFEPVSIPSYNFIDSCPGLSIQSPAEVYLPSNVYSSIPFAPAPFYVDQREATNSLSSVTPVAAEIYIPSEIKANLICDLIYTPNSLPLVNVVPPLFEIEADFSNLFGSGFYGY